MKFARTKTFDSTSSTRRTLRRGKDPKRRAASAADVARRGGGRVSYPPRKPHPRFSTDRAHCARDPRRRPLSRLDMAARPMLSAIATALLAEIGAIGNASARTRPASDHAAHDAGPEPGGSRPRLGAYVQTADTPCSGPGSEPAVPMVGPNTGRWSRSAPGERPCAGSRRGFRHRGTNGTRASRASISAHRRRGCSRATSSGRILPAPAEAVPRRRADRRLYFRRRSSVTAVDYPRTTHASLAAIWQRRRRVARADAHRPPGKPYPFGRRCRAGSCSRRTPRRRSRWHDEFASGRHHRLG